MNKRLKFKCWNCKREYSLLCELTTEQTLFVACPFCDAEALADLAPFRKKVKTVLRSADEQEQDLGEMLDLPEALPTQKPE